VRRPPDQPHDALNRSIASKLREFAGLLAQQQANPFRVRAYERAAQTLEALDEGVDRVLDREGPPGLHALDGIGPRMAAAISEMVRSGHFSQLERARGTLDPEQLLRTLPGIGPTLARRIHDALQVDSLEALEVAAHDGRLAGVPGMGRRRLEMLRAELAVRLGRARRRVAAPVEPIAATVAEPPLELLLDVDREYRRKASEGVLPRIAPRRFNPTGEAWLPILHTARDAWQFSALYSNTALAHRLDRTRDWVVIYFHSDHRAEGQVTVVTETRGDLAGRRVVRGHEPGCRALYARGAEPGAIAAPPT